MLKNNVEYQGLVLSNNVCEYEVNPLTNELLQKSKTLTQSVFKNNVKCQGHLKVNVIMMPTARTDSPIYKPKYVGTVLCQTSLVKKLGNIACITLEIVEFFPTFWFE